MLSPVKLRIFILFLGVMIPLSVKGNSCSQDQDFSWVKKVNLQAQELSKAPLKEAPLRGALLEEAQSVVQNALESASNPEACSQAKELVRLGETKIRQTLKSSLSEGSLLKGSLLEGAISTSGINGNSKELSDSRVTETGVNDTGIDDTRIDDTLPYPKLLVFVSFSMPPKTLKALDTQVRQLGGKLVLRGLRKGSFQETAQKLKELQIDVMIDPTLFEAYHITKSPTFILRKSSTESPEEEVAFDRMTGNVSLEYVLEQFSSSRETQDEALQTLKILRREP